MIISPKLVADGGTKWFITGPHFVGMENGPLWTLIFLFAMLGSGEWFRRFSDHNGVVPQKLSWCVYNSKFTMFQTGDISHMNLYCPILIHFITRFTMGMSKNYHKPTFTLLFCCTQHKHTWEPGHLYYVSYYIHDICIYLGVRCVAQQICVCLLIYLSIYLSNLSNLSFYLSICLSIHLSIYLPI